MKICGVNSFMAYNGFAVFCVILSVKTKFCVRVSKTKIKRIYEAKDLAPQNSSLNIIPSKK